MGADQPVISESHVFDAWVEECYVAGVADFVVFDLRAVGLDAVAYQSSIRVPLLAFSALTTSR